MVHQKYDLGVPSACPRDHRTYDWIAVATFAFLAVEAVVVVAVVVPVLASAVETPASAALAAGKDVGRFEPVEAVLQTG